MVSVIMPVFNGEKYISRAIDSVVGQTCGLDRLELIIIDDGSQDRTEEIIKTYTEKYGDHIHYLKNPGNQGVAYSRNRGFQEARGQYVALLDADDWWDSTKLEKQLSALADGRHVICCSGRELMSPEGEPTGKVIEVPEEITYKMCLRTNILPCSSVMLKTEVAREFGMERDDLHEDYILWLKVLRKYGTCIGLGEPLLKSRLSQGGKSRNKKNSAAMTWGVYRYMGFSIVRSLFYFCAYAVNGVKKYL